MLTIKKMEEQTMKLLNKTFKLAILLVAGILVYILGQIAYQSKLLEQQNTNQITVSGEGKVYAKPDIAIVSLGVKIEGLTVAIVTKSNTDKMNAVIEAVKELGVDEKDIQTTNYYLTPIYNWTENQGQFFQGYTLSQNIQVKIRDFTKIGDVLSQGTAKGANLVGDLQFTIDEPENLKAEARAKAIAQAKDKAEKLAKDSGIDLGKLVNVYENSNDYYPRDYNQKGGMGGSLELASAPTIQPGQQEVNVSVTLTYKVK